MASELVSIWSTASWKKKCFNQSYRHANSKARALNMLKPRAIFGSSATLPKIYVPPFLCALGKQVP